MIDSLLLCHLLWRCKQAKRQRKRKEKEKQGNLNIPETNNELNDSLNNPNFTVYIKGKYADDESNLH